MEQANGERDRDTDRFCPVSIVRAHCIRDYLLLGSTGEAELHREAEMHRRSRVAQRKRAGPITQRSMDRNHPLLRSVASFTLKPTALCKGLHELLHLCISPQICPLPFTWQYRGS